MRLKLRTKLALAAAAPLIVAASIGLVTGHRALKDGAVEQSSRRMQLVADLYAARFDGQFSTITQAARGIAQFLATHDQTSDKELFESLRRLVAEQPLVYGSCVAFEPGMGGGRERFAPYVFRDRTKDGAISSIDIANAYDYADGSWEWYRAPKEQNAPTWTEPYFDKGAGNILMCTYSVPLVRDGRFIGVVTADVALDQLDARVDHDDLEGGSFAILSRKGTIISFDIPEYIGRNARELMDPGGKREDVQLLAQASEFGKRGVLLMKDFPTAGNHFMCYAPIPSTGWEFFAEVPEDMVMSGVYAALSMRTAFFVAITVATIGVVVFATRRVTRPIAQLARAVKHLGAGDLEMPSIDVPGKDELGDLARAFNRMVRDLRTHVQALTEETAARERVEGDLRIAREIQSSLLPRANPPFPGRTEFSLHGLNIPARHVAGDFYDYFFVAPDKLLFVIADVSGKGIPAAMFMAVARTLLHQLAAQDANPSPARILTIANKLLASENERGMFVTVFLGLYDTATGAITYANAGHPKPYRVKDGALPTAFGDITGTVVAAIDDAAFEERIDILHPGEKLVLYTDGVTEAAPPLTVSPDSPGPSHGPLYGDARTADLCASVASQSAEAMCAAIAQAVDEYQRHEPRDDVTVVVLARER